MKKTIVCFLMLMTASQLAAQDFLSNSEVDSLWRNTTITVKGGGLRPDVVMLLEAFHKALPTWVVGEVMKQHAHPAKGTKRNGSTTLLESHDNDDFELLIDPKNGYVDFSSQTDIDQMEACIWRRSNAHTLFAISLYEQHDPVQHLLCWFDYDPATQTMKAEKSPIDTYKKPFENIDFGWALPRKGTDFVIREYYNYLIPTVTRIYHWDGMHHKLAKTLIADFKYGWFGSDDMQQASKEGYDKYAIVNLEGSPVLCLKKTNSDMVIDNILVVAPFKNSMQAVAANDESTIIEGFFQVKPEEGAPWKGKEVVIFCRDFESVNYYSVINDGLVSYFVADEPMKDDSGATIGYTPSITGYGGKDESIHIMHASIAKRVEFNPQWQSFEYTEEERF